MFGQLTISCPITIQIGTLMSEGPLIGMERVFALGERRFEDTVKNLLKMPPKPHKPAKAEKDGQDEPDRQVAKPSKDG